MKNLTFNEIHDKIESLGNSQHVTLGMLVAIYLPENLYSTYSSCLAEQGYSCTFWGVPVLLGDNDGIRLQWQ